MQDVLLNGAAASSLVNWISDALSQGYTTLQSLVKCLDHRKLCDRQLSRASNGAVIDKDAIVVAFHSSHALLGYPN